MHPQRCCSLPQFEECSATDLLQERSKVKVLSKELESTLNVHRCVS